MQVGTAVVTRQDKRLAVGRLGALVEQIEALVSKDLQVILVRLLDLPLRPCSTFLLIHRALVAGP